jgi:DNA-binding transcriptional LysR family regulator
MLRDFAKLQTFMMVIKEKSFSKASAKLGISQPAVTQQIKYIEEYLDTKIVKRKKNGILLTKEGEDLYRIVRKLEKCIQNSEKELLKIVNK